jgi:hypothetical protein
MLTPLVLGGGDDERTQERPADEMAVFLSQAGAADGGAKGIDLIGDRSEVVRLQRLSEPRAFRLAGGGGRDIGAAADRALCPGRLGLVEGGEERVPDEFLDECPRQRAGLVAHVLDLRQRLVEDGIEQPASPSGGDGDMGPQG